MSIELARYTGYLQPYMQIIVRAHLSGKPLTEIARDLPESPYGPVGPDLVRYALRRVGALPNADPFVAWQREREAAMVAQRRTGSTYAEIGEAFHLSSTRVGQILHEAERKCLAAARRQGRRSRPLDMGGIRDQWQHWTPESNARELGLI